MVHHSRIEHASARDRWNAPPHEGRDSDPFACGPGRGKDVGTCPARRPPHTPRPPAARVTLRGVRRVFPPDVVTLDDFSLDVEAGDFVSILGPIRFGQVDAPALIAGLDASQAGSVEVRPPAAAAPATGRASDVAYVFQDAHLLPWRDVRATWSSRWNWPACPPRGGRTRARRDRAGRSLRRNHAVPQRTVRRDADARLTLAARARHVAPAPAARRAVRALDEITRQRLDEQLRALWDRRRMTVLFVTHSTAEAAFLARRAVVLSTRPGRIVEDRRIDLPASRPGSLRATAAFARETRVLYDAARAGRRVTPGARPRLLARVLPPLVVFAAAVASLEAYVRCATCRRTCCPSRRRCSARSCASGPTCCRRSRSRRPPPSSASRPARCSAAAAIGLAASPLVRRAFYPYALFFQTVPIVAVARCW